MKLSVIEIFQLIFFFLLIISSFSYWIYKSIRIKVWKNINWWLIVNIVISLILNIALFVLIILGFINLTNTWLTITLLPSILSLLITVQIIIDIVIEFIKNKNATL